MMSLLSRHLEQINLCSQSIATLPFPAPQIFTNALLAPHDITALIRDTESHERALFSVPPPPKPSSASEPEPASKRRQTVFAVQSGEITSGAATQSRAAPRRNTAVAAVLGPELNREIRRAEKGELDVEVLLRGAEKLLEVHSVSGADDQIAALRRRYARVKGNLRVYEEKVQRQAKELERMNRGGWSEDDEAEMMDAVEPEGVEVTDEDIWAEEEQVRELERKKRQLEERVNGMERDLGGLLR